MPENNAMRTPLSKEISPMEITFDKMYACIDMGETANACITFSLFSNNIIAPININPISTGSENIRVVVHSSFHGIGRMRNTVTYIGHKNHICIVAEYHLVLNL